MRQKSLIEHLLHLPSAQCSCDIPYPVTWTQPVFESVFVLLAPTLPPDKAHGCWEIVCPVTKRLALYLPAGNFNVSHSWNVSFNTFNPNFSHLLYIDDVTPACAAPATNMSFAFSEPPLSTLPWPPFWCMDWPGPFYRGSPAVLNKVPAWEMGLWREVMLVMSDRIHPHISPQPLPLPHSQWAPSAPFAIAL